MAKYSSDNVIDHAEHDTAVAPVQYEITSFGADYDVEGLVNRLQRGDIFIPSFQRDYVWTQKEASRFVESLLLGLPIPGIFLVRELKSNKMLVIDGQQRLRTLQFFYEGFFNPKPEDRVRKVFKLVEVQAKFRGCTYNALEERDRIKLRDAIIHATIVKQESPQNNDTSVYHIFERLNNGGRKLAPQQIRVAIYHGSFMDLIKDLNDYEVWRGMFGKKSPYLKDQELILRFFALYFNVENYERPMNEFLNTFAKEHQQPDLQFLDSCRHIFTRTIDTIAQITSNKAFRIERALNAAVYDSVMYGIARRLEVEPINDFTGVRKAYDSLLSDRSYRVVVSSATSDEANLRKRLELATKAFSDA